MKYEEFQACVEKHRPSFFLLTLIVFIGISCTDGERMRQRLLEVQACNQADTVFSARWIPTVDSLVDFFDSHGTPNERLMAHYLLARTYTDMGEAPQALDEFHRAAACADTTSTDCDYSLLARAYGQMAELLYVNELPRNALHAFLQAYHFSGLAQETNIASYYFSQQGKCYYDLMLPDSAIIIAEQAIQMLYECGDTLTANTLFTFLLLLNEIIRHFAAFAANNTCQTNNPALSEIKAGFLKKNYRVPADCNSIKEFLILS